ncbi:DUF3995 domain-containing protein [Yinghuangia sp. YIM S09857]|uniref:DUF3995 domain-containing protein n=1 Tax=Yinghuangia sp. YIM S09857 TaxID=3436929 RepID=UPI003F5303D9
MSEKAAAQAVRPTQTSATSNAVPWLSWRGLVRLTAAFTALFAALHVYWAVGGTWGLPPAAHEHAASVRATNWAVTAVMAFGVCWILALEHPAARRPPPWVPLAPLWVASVVCISHAVFGFATKGLYLAGLRSAVDFPDVQGLDAATLNDKNHWAAVHDILVFEPCFAVQGLLLAALGHRFARTRRGRRAWSGSLAAGTVAIDAFGIALVLVGHHVTVS